MQIAFLSIGWMDDLKQQNCTDIRIDIKSKTCIDRTIDIDNDILTLITKDK